MATIRIASIIVAAALALTSGVVSAQGVTVLTGAVIVDGQPAPVDTQVSVSFQDGTVVGTGITGSGGLALNQYRIDVQMTGALEGRTVNIDVAGTFQDIQATTVLSANRVRTVDIFAATGLASETVLAPLENAGALELASAFDYGTGLFEAYVPGLPSNSLRFIRPNTVLFITMTQDTTVVVSGVPFFIRAFLPTPVPVGATVTIAVQ